MKTPSNEPRSKLSPTKKLPGQSQPPNAQQQTHTSNCPTPHSASDEDFQPTVAHNCDAAAPVQKLQLLAEEVFLPNPHARFNNRGQQDLVHVFLHGADQLHGLFDLALSGLAVERPQENRTGDLRSACPKPVLQFHWTSLTKAIEKSARGVT